MSEIRFYYTKSDINEGKKYLKSTDQYNYLHLENIIKNYKCEIHNNNPNIPHAAKCPGMNRIKRTGWISFNENEIHGKDALGYGPEAHGFVNDTFINYSNSEDYVIYKMTSHWNVNIPSGYYLMSIPTLYHTRNWFSFSGILDAENSLLGFYQLNSFIYMHKNEIIPVGSPIAQWILVKKENYNVIMESMNNNDKEAINYRNILADIKNKDYEKYKIIKQSGLFKS